MPRKQIKVEKVKKYRTREKVVKTWDSIVMAFKGEKIGYTTLMKAIDEQTPLKGYYYRRIEHRPKIKPAKKDKQGARRSPSFSGPRGMFSIKKWGDHISKYLP